MPTKLLSILLVFSLATLVSCDQSEDDSPVNKIPKVKAVSWFSDGQSTGGVAFKYDPAGRLYRVTLSSLKYDTYAYEPGKVIINRHNADGSLFLTETLVLNDKGLAIANRTTTYEYDEDGYKIKYSPQDTLPVVYQISSGNTISGTESGADYLNVWTCKYLPNINTIGEENKGITWFGKQDKNLPYELHRYTKDGDRLNETTIRYTYEFDAKNRVIKKTTTGESSEFYEKFTYY